MSDNNEVVAIISVYKADTVENFIVAIESLLCQTKKCDIVIYRDGPISHDLANTLRKYKKYNNIHIIHSNINRGLANALNVMIEHCLSKNYKYIARMDSDDISLPCRISQQTKFLDDNPNVSVVGSYCQEFGASFSLDVKKLPVCHEELKKMSIHRCPFIHPTVMFRLSIFESKIIRYPENTFFTEDMSLWFLLLEHGFYFANIPKVLLKYRINDKTLSRRKGYKKTISEIKLRLVYMRKLNLINIKNIFFILSRVVFYFMPNFVVKYIYKNYR